MRYRRVELARAAFFALALGVSCDDRVAEGPAGELDATPEALDSDVGTAKDLPEEVPDTRPHEVSEADSATDSSDGAAVDTSSDTDDAEEVDLCTGVPFRAIEPTWPRIQNRVFVEGAHALASAEAFTALVGQDATGLVDFTSEWVVHLVRRRPPGGAVELTSVERCPGRVPEVEVRFVTRDPDATCLVQPHSDLEFLHGFFAIPIPQGLSPESVAAVYQVMETFSCTAASPGDGDPCVAGELCQPGFYCAGLTGFYQGSCVPQAWLHESTNLNELPIPDSPAPGPTSTNTIVAPSDHVVRDLVVQWSIDHPQTSDLRYVLTSPTGHVVDLVRPGTTLSITTAVPVAFFGEGAAGTWTLGITDEVASNAGYLSSWYLALVSAPP